VAVGDVQTAISSIANNAVLDIKPASGAEWVVHNVLYGASMELYKTDGINSIKVDSDTTAGGRIGVYLHCTNLVWYQLKNVSGANMALSYDGVQTK
jgi:hypothetical protein